MFIYDTTFIIGVRRGLQRAPRRRNTSEAPRRDVSADVSGCLVISSGPVQYMTDVRAILYGR